MDKMILVPHDIMKKEPHVTQIKQNFDSEMRKILDSKSLPTDVKLMKYNQLLHQYTKAKQVQEQPHKLKIIEPKSQPLDEDVLEDMPIEEDTQWQFDAILDGIPPKNKKVAQKLLNHVQTNPHIDWSESGELIFGDKIIVGSHIMDLMHDFSRDRRTKEPAIGAEAFAIALAKGNVPRELIINKRRLDLMSSDVAYATPPQGHPIMTVKERLALSPPPECSVFHECK